MFVAGGFQHRHRHFEKFSVCITILSKFAASMTEKKLRVFLIRQAVSGNVLRLERDRSLYAAAIGQDLARQTEHQIDVDVREPSRAKNSK